MLAGEGISRTKSGINGKWYGLILRGKMINTNLKKRGLSKAKGRIQQASQGKGHSQECKPISQSSSIGYIKKGGLLTQEKV